MGSTYARSWNAEKRPVCKGLGWLYPTHRNRSSASRGSRCNRLLLFARLRGVAPTSEAGCPPGRVAVPEYRAAASDRNREAPGSQTFVFGISGERGDVMSRASARCFTRLEFRYAGQVFPCNEKGLVRLGRVHKNNPSLEEPAALREGVNQFKVELTSLRKLREEDDWVHQNVLVAVAAGNDGLAGLAKDSSFHAQRQELGRFAHIIFSSSSKDREYWLGTHPDFSTYKHTQSRAFTGATHMTFGAPLNLRRDTVGSAPSRRSTVFDRRWPSPPDAYISVSCLRRGPVLVM